jgi:succinate dehydrogenase/fumarate reductase flavoprotein subunit
LLCLLISTLQVITYAQLERIEDLSVSIPDRVKVLKKARVSKILKDDSGGVVGVEYIHSGKTETAYGPVILATGGYAADFTEDSLLKKHRPEYWDLPTTNGDHCTGDGQKLAMSIGASAVDLEKVQVHPTGLVDPNEPDAKVKFLAAEALRGVGGLLLDNTGKRFVDELQHRDFVTGKIWENKKVRICLCSKSVNAKELLSTQFVSSLTVPPRKALNGIASTTLDVVS